MATTGWEVIDEAAGLFTIEHAASSGWCWRALALRLDGDELLLVSPIRGTLERAPLDGIGRPVLALAPNHFHHLGLPEARARHPELVCVATSAARPRLARKHAHAFAPMEVLRERLPRGVEVLEPPGLKNGEAWLRIETSRGVAWAVCDAFFHVTRPVSGAMGMMLRATQTVPGLRIGSTFLWLATRDRRAYRSWLEERVRADRPRVLIPSHGEVLADEALPDRLAELAARRL